MEQATLINEAASLINAAATIQSEGKDDMARAQLLELQALLNDELIADAPADPETPTPNGVT